MLVIFSSYYYFRQLVFGNLLINHMIYTDLESLNSLLSNRSIFTLYTKYLLALKIHSFSTFFPDPPTSPDHNSVRLVVLCQHWGRGSLINIFLQVQVPENSKHPSLPWHPVVSFEYVTRFGKILQTCGFQT